jgi:hypothetical protein
MRETLDRQSLSDPDRSLVLSHFLTNFLQNLASCQTSFRDLRVQAFEIPLFSPRPQQFFFFFFIKQ